jgi:hypothetical protein
MTINELKSISKYLNIAEVCRSAGHDYQSIVGKIRNERELNVIESNNLFRVIELIYRSVGGAR